MHLSGLAKETPLKFTFIPLTTCVSNLCYVADIYYINASPNRSRYNHQNTTSKTDAHTNIGLPVTQATHFDLGSRSRLHSSFGSRINFTLHLLANSLMCRSIESSPTAFSCSVYLQVYRNSLLIQTILYSCSILLFSLTGEQIRLRYSLT